MRLRVLLLGCIVAILPCLGQAQLLPSVPNPAARAWLLVDFASGQTLAARNADTRVEPASLTKIMTAYVAFAALRQGSVKLSDKTSVSERAWHAIGSRMFIDPKKPVTIDELLRGMIVQSGNDASTALAEAIGGTEDAFVQMMNREAQRLGMKSTHFMNATGLPDDRHYTTAGDLALLTAALIRDFPEFYPLYAIREYRYNNITQMNRNRLLWSDPYVDGVKTGHTDTAGFCLVASAKRQDRRLISVLLGSASDSVRAGESQKLLNFGFQFFDAVKLFANNQAVSQLQVWKGSAQTVKAGFQRDFYVTVPKGQADKLKANLVSQQPLVAPITAGQVVGTLRVSLDGRPVGEFPAVALETVEIAGWFGRVWDSIRLMFK